LYFIYIFGEIKQHTMKLKLLLSALFISGVTFAQEAIPAFYDLNIPGSTEGDGYILVNAPANFDESTSGANAVWNFNDLENGILSSTVVVAPSDADVATYPGTTMLVETTAGESITKYFFAGGGSADTSLTGFETSGMSLNYSTNNASIGSFPLSYGYANTDDVAGTFTGMGFSGTFTGTGTTTFDGYGSLIADIIFTGDDGVEVRRLKTEQNLSLMYMGAPVGTLTQTIYSYYNWSLTNGPIFRSIKTTLNVPILSVNQTTHTLEGYLETVLNSGPVAVIYKTVIAPNPVTDVLHFAGDSTITRITITDASGRIVLQPKAGNDIPVNHLSAGVYYVAVQSGNLTEVKKMIKR
jgi:hypothetical protein